MARTRLRTKLLALVVSPLLCLGLLELVLRAAGFRYTPYVTESAQEDWRLPPAHFRRDPRLLWTMPKSTVVDAPEAGFPHVVTNELGLRGPLASRTRPPEEVRILCLGDSVTFGMGVEDALTWPAQLEQVLAESPELAGRPVHVMNGGIPGWSSVQGLRLLDQTGWYEPDVIVFWFGMNDVQPAWGRPDSMKGTDPGALTEIAHSLSWLRTVQLISRVVDSFGNAGEGATRASVPEFAGAIERLQAIQAAGGPKVVFVRHPEQIGRTVAQIDRMIARAEEEGVDRVAGPRPLILSITPAPEGTDLTGEVVEGPRGRELRFAGEPVVRATVASLRIDVEGLRTYEKGLVTRRALLPADSLGAEDFFPGEDVAKLMTDNCHLNPPGCRLVAEAMAERILTLLRP